MGGLLNVMGLRVIVKMKMSTVRKMMMMMMSWERMEVSYRLLILRTLREKGPHEDQHLANGKLNGQVLNGEKEMVTPVIRANLEKQGYKIIGSHSGVKLCRWTKSQLRGRRGCYKHSFYGIESHSVVKALPRRKGDAYIH